MTAREKLTEYAAAWIADCGESYDTADAHAAQLVEEFRAEVLREAAALIRHHHGGDHHYAQLLDQAADAAAPTSKEPQR